MIDRIKIKEKAKTIVKENLGKIWLVYGFVLILTLAIDRLVKEVTKINTTCLYSIEKIDCIYTQGEIYGDFVNLGFSILIAFLTFVMSYYLLKIVRNKKAEFNDVFVFKKDFFKIFLIALVSDLLISFGYILIIPGIILSIAYSMISYIYSDKKLEIIETLKASRDLMYGYKFNYFIFICSFLGWIFLSILTLGIGFAWTLPYMLVSQTLYYEELKSFKSN